MNTTENETIDDLETALDAWDMVTDANDEQWIRDGNEGVRRRVVDAFWLLPDSDHSPTPPFTNAYEMEKA